MDGALLVSIQAENDDSMYVLLQRKGGEMTPMEQFKKEVGLPILVWNATITIMYIDWLERQIEIREQAAFEAAREVQYSDEGTGSWEYETFEDWEGKDNGK